jgi:hypothetical protein
MLPPQDIAQPIQLTWRAQEVVRVIDRRPHLLLRITITGTTFQQRAAAPFLLVVAGESVTHAWSTTISDDLRELHGDFPTDLVIEGIVEYGYGARVFGRVAQPLQGGAIARLDRARLPPDIVDATRAYIAKVRDLPSPDAARP